VCKKECFVNCYSEGQIIENPNINKNCYLPDEENLNISSDGNYSLTFLI
jgi:hypothetical protein